jgi:macrocin-O-methyltransferase TylF-like protien
MRESGDPGKVFSHSGDIEDVIYHLPIIQQSGVGQLILFPNPDAANRLTPERAESLATLLRIQPYLSSVEWKQAPEGLILDPSRNAVGHHSEDRNSRDSKRPNPTEIACQWAGLAIPDSEQPWLFAEAHRISRVVFHRSPQPHNSNFPWKRVYETYRKEALFLGDPQEHANFCQLVGPISYYYTETMLDLARVIRGCELFVGNQSAPYAVAEGLKVPTILEIAPTLNNCCWERVGNIHGWDATVVLPALKDLPERLVESTIARAQGHTLIPNRRMGTLARIARDLSQLPGDMAELGVYKGGSAKVLASMAPHKTLHLFDTFQGIPEDDFILGGHKKGDFAANIEAVRTYLSGYKTTFNVGRFPETTNNIPSTTRFSLVHLDADIYQSTVDGIKFFWPRLVPGGLLLFDDFRWKNCPGVEKAIQELLPGETIESGNLQAWVRKK